MVRAGTETVQADRAGKSPSVAFFFRTAGFVDWHHHKAHVLAGAAMSTIHWDYSAGCRADRYDSDRRGGVRPPGSRQEAGAAVLGSPITPQFALNDLGPHADSRGRPEGNEPGLGVSEIVRLNTAPLGTARTTKSPY
jgi:hypothetical protein